MDDVLEVGNEFTDPPIIRAAGRPDIDYLRQAIDRFSNDTTCWKDRFDPNFQCDWYFHGHSETPLIEAARHGLEQHVALLLKAGADPENVHVRYLGKPITPTWMEPLSEGQLTLRKRADKRARFWCHLDPGWEKNRGLPLTVLEAAAISGNIAIVRVMLAASRNITPPACAVQEKAGKASYFAPSPLVAAVKHGHLEIVQLLLESGFDAAAMPNAPLSWTCITPAMALIHTETSRLEILQALCRSNASPALLSSTPVFGINPFHFAAAALDSELLEAMHEYIDVSKVSPTALGHTLLHIACLPFDDTYVKVFSQAIADSIHDVRTLSLGWYPERIAFFRHINQPKKNYEISNIEFSLNGKSALLLPQSTGSFQSQFEIIRFLAAAGVANCSAQDYMGNTACTTWLRIVLSIRKP